MMLHERTAQALHLLQVSLLSSTHFSYVQQLKLQKYANTK